MALLHLHLQRAPLRLLEQVRQAQRTTQSARPMRELRLMKESSFSSTYSFSSSSSVWGSLTEKSSAKKHTFAGEVSELVPQITFCGSDTVGDAPTTNNSAKNRRLEFGVQAAGEGAAHSGNIRK